MSNMNKVLGFERINERRQRPNKLINFIKPREGPDKELAQDFLERVAAICYPIMKANHVVVMALEEYPSNKEFLGRNFNAGEIIQLVLKTPSGQWYPLKHVQMVMMHELAHCKQMNHSRDFWKVNNGLRDELKDLWNRKYTGEGLWGRGRGLLDGRFSNDHMPEAADTPANLCGGTYRSRGGRKRKRVDANKPQLSYAERKQRRIAKKFGVNGQALGADEYARFGLDQGRHRPSKPRVAGSKRGRELRAAAALARFDKPKVEDIVPKQEPVSDEDFETDSDEEEPSLTGEWDDNNDVVKVCENEDLGDEEARHEMDELNEIDQPQSTANTGRRGKNPRTIADKSSPSIVLDLDDEDHGSDASTASEDEAMIKSEPQDFQPTEFEASNTPTISEHASVVANVDPKPTAKATTTISSSDLTPNQQVLPEESTTARTTKTSKPPDKVTSLEISQPSNRRPNQTSSAVANDDPGPPTSPAAHTTHACPICSYENGAGAASCTVCAHVIDTHKIQNSWQCQSEACKGSVYRNLGDYGRCYVCQAKREP